MVDAATNKSRVPYDRKNLGKEETYLDLLLLGVVRNFSQYHSTSEDKVLKLAFSPSLTLRPNKLCVCVSQPRMRSKRVRFTLGPTLLKWSPDNYGESDLTVKKNTSLLCGICLMIPSFLVNFGLLKGISG
jgi:hypothetical protein